MNGFTARRNAVDAVLNGGGGTVTLESTNGSLTLRTVAQAPSGQAK